MALTVSLPYSPQETHRGERAGLVMTDLAMMFVLLLVVFLALDPFLLYIDKRGFLKHVSLVFALPTFVLAWIGVRVAYPSRSYTSVFTIAWPLVVMALLIITGSLYARFHSHVHETFLIMGMYMLISVFAARFIADHHNPSHVLNAYVVLLFIAIVTGAVWQAVKLQRWSEFHEEEFLTVPLAVFFYVLSRGVVGRTLSMILLFLLMLLVIKNTSFIVAALVCGYLWWGFMRVRTKRMSGAGQLLHYYALTSACALIAAVYFGIKHYNHHALPDGNPKYRMFTYEQTWAAFTSSPIWGKAFAGAGAEKFGLFQVMASTQVLPSHSDILDILAQGGTIGILLFAYGLFRVGRYIRSRFVARGEGALSPVLVAHFHWIAASSLTAIPVVAFNPIMLQPGKAFLLWLNLGILIGLAIRCAEHPSSHEPSPSS
jgi:hypothetical protein